MRNSRFSWMNSFIKKDKKLATIVLASVLAVTLLITTFAWYVSKVSLEGSSFSTGTLDFIATGYDKDGNHITTILQDNKKAEDYAQANKPLFNKKKWHANVTETAYIVIENTGSLAMDYRISFSAAGEIEYLGGFWYALTDITDKVPAGDSVEARLQAYAALKYDPKTENDGYNMATMDRYATVGTAAKAEVQYYRLDYGMSKTAISDEYTNKSVQITPKIYVTQVGALDNDAGYGHTYNCTNVNDIIKARDYSLPGDSIKLMNNITFEGDLVFNKAINILTNNFKLEVRGNLIYDYVSTESLNVNVTGNGTVNVISPAEGIGGNFTVTAPASNVTFVGNNKVSGDIVVNRDFTVNATRSYGEAGATFDKVKIIADVDSRAAATVLVSDDTRITVADNTTLARLEAVAQSKNIEISNAGTVQTVSLSEMYELSPAPLSPQIYIVNMGYIVDPIELPTWSSKYVVLTTDPLTTKGNTRIVQTITGNNMTVTGSDTYTDADIEKESTDITVAPIGNNDGELVVYYQNIEENGETVITDIQYLLEKYFTEKGKDAATAIANITRLDIVSIGDKSVTNEDITYFKSSALNNLDYLSLERASVYDTATNTPNKLCEKAFDGFKDFTTLILPQNLTEIGNYALRNMQIDDIVNIPGSVTAFGTECFNGNSYVAFSASTPVESAYTATKGMNSIKAIFVEEYYIDAYKAMYTDYADIIFPMAQKADSEFHFVRQLSGSNEWEIVYYINNGSTNVSVGDNMRVNGNIINVVGVGARSYAAALNNVEATVKFDDSIRYISEKAFCKTKIIEVSHWSNSLETIGMSAFESCKGLTAKIVLPDSLEILENSVFKNCSNIPEINTGGATTLGSQVFYSCSNLVAAQLPEVLTIGDGETDNYTFGSCTKLVSVEIPKLYSVNKSYMFYDCDSIRELIMGSAESDVTLGTSPFSQANKTYLKLFVPVELLEKYKSIRPGAINAECIYPIGEKMNEVYVNGFNIGEYIVSDELNGDGTATLITTNVYNLSGTVEIPADWNGNPITTIYDGAFRNCSFTSATLKFSNNLRSIGNYAFYLMNGIIDVEHWGDSLESIGNHAFRGTGIGKADADGKVILTSEKLSHIGNYAFYNCDSMAYVNTGSATELGISVFGYCDALVEAELPNVTSIGDGTTSHNYTFASCYKLVSVKIPNLNSVQNQGLFYDCEALREMNMECDLPALGSQPFSEISTAQRKRIKLFVPSDLVETYKTNLSSISSYKDQIYPEGEKIGEELVNGYDIGKFIVMDNGDGNSVTLITSTLEFTGTVDLNTVDDLLGGRNVTKIGEYAFVNQMFTSASLIIGDNVTEIGKYAFRNVTSTTTHGNNYLTGIISIDLRNTEIVYDYAFNKCTGMTELVANKLVRIEGGSAFAGCSALQTINLPKLQYAAGNSFSSCTALISVSVPELLSMGDYVFAYNTKLESIYFEKIRTFGTSADSNDFYGCTALKEFIINKNITDADGIPTGNPHLNDSKSTCIILVPAIHMDAYTDDSGKWRGCVVASYDKVFEDNGNTYIVDIDGADSVKIKHYFGNTVVSSLVIPNTMTIDGVPYKVISIASGAFNSAATTLNELTLPSGMYQFPSLCLSELTALTSITVADGNGFYSSIDGVLYNFDGGMLIKYPCGRSDTSYIVNASVFAIGEYAFQNCTNLKSIQFGENLTVIDSTAFTGCALQSITFTGVTAPVLMGASIFDTTVEGFAIAVPTGAEASYAGAMNFAQYAPFFTAPTEVPDSGNTLPWSSSTATVQYALPPASSEVQPSKEEEEDPAA